mmetsp:Transcript_97726/g.232699  ORF Transcript_97726/g.232699 Transcript_97726/m.232699 type:complete len:405 (+) Transcript_97726:483-1697(+)
MCRIRQERRIDLRLCGEAKHDFVAQEGHRVGQLPSLEELAQASAPASSPTEAGLAIEGLQERPLPKEDPVRRNDDVRRGVVRGRQHTRLRAGPVVEGSLFLVAEVDVWGAPDYIGFLRVDVPDTLNLLVLRVLLLEEALFHRVLAEHQRMLINTSLLQLLHADVHTLPCQHRNDVENVHSIAAVPRELEDALLALHVDHSRHELVAHATLVPRQDHVRASAVKQISVVAECIDAKVYAQETGPRQAELLADVEEAHVGDDDSMHRVLELHEEAEHEMQDRKKQSSSDGLDNLAGPNEGVVSDFDGVRRCEEEGQAQYDEAVEHGGAQVGKPHPFHLGPRSHNLLLVVGRVSQAKRFHRHIHLQEHLREIHLNDRLLRQELLPGGHLILQGVGFHSTILILAVDV